MPADQIRCFGGPADGRWFRADGRAVVLFAVPQSLRRVTYADYAPTASVEPVSDPYVQYNLKRWACHDSRHCLFPALWQAWGQHPALWQAWGQHPVEYACLWRGEAWIQEGDEHTIRWITQALNLIALLCLPGVVWYNN